MGALDRIVLAYHGGVSGGRPERDADQLRAIAAWLDLIDDVSDEALREAGMDHRVGRDIQADLRRIASRLDSDGEAS